MWLKVGNEVRRAWYASGSGTADLVFAYTVQSGDVDTNGVSLCSDTSLHRTCGGITKNGGTIMATADDTTVPLNYPELGNQAAHGIGGPQVIGVAMQSAPASGDTYAAAETVTVRLTFAEAVDVTGRPFVYLNVGGAVRKAVFASGSGSANLDFAFTVQAADFDANGVSVCSSRLLDRGCGRVQLDGGAIVASADALVADLVLPAQDDQSGHKVDGTPVTIDPGGSTMGDPAMGTVPQTGACIRKASRQAIRSGCSSSRAARATRTRPTSTTTTASCKGPQPAGTPRSAGTPEASARSPAPTASMPATTPRPQGRGCRSTG